MGMKADRGISATLQDPTPLKHGASRGGGGSCGIADIAVIARHRRHRKGKTEFSRRWTQIVTDEELKAERTSRQVNTQTSKEENGMKIGILGSGRIGATAARLFVGAGHEVAIANSRGPDSLLALVKELAPHGQAATVIEAARFGEMVLLAIPWHAEEGLPPAELLRNKIVIDAMNPYRPQGGFFDLGDSTSSEIVQQRRPGARLVKAFNTIYYGDLATRGRRELAVQERHAIYVAGDDAPAKQAISRLIEGI